MVWNKFSGVLNGIGTKLDGLNTWLSGVSEKITGLPDLVWGKFNDHIWTIKDKLGKAVDGITGLPDVVWGKFSEVLNGIKDLLSPESIIELLKTVFLPDEQFFSDHFDILKGKLEERLSYNAYIEAVSLLKNVTTGSIPDVKATLWGTECTIVNMGFIRDNIRSLHSLIRGVFFILLALYNYRMVLFLIRGTDYIGAGGHNAMGQKVGQWTSRGSKGAPK